jgi:hypothetical protein
LRTLLLGIDNSSRTEFITSKLKLLFS